MAANAGDQIAVINLRDPLGSRLESDEAVREAIYRRPPGRDGNQVAEED